MEDAILTQEELKSISGYKTSARIAVWLKANRIPFLTNGRGRPLVSRLVVRAALGENLVTSAPTPLRSINLDQLNKVTRR
ncbi:DUF4224 domain-containing protein [Neisseriaceae bacterium JH1-16]|nr:DUF4224 domain-containing protein [Neisseriaceae bacterium JH1-16]